MAKTIEINATDPMFFKNWSATMTTDYEVTENLLKKALILSNYSLDVDTYMLRYPVDYDIDNPDFSDLYDVRLLAQEMSDHIRLAMTDGLISDVMFREKFVEYFRKSASVMIDAEKGKYRKNSQMALVALDWIAKYIDKVQDPDPKVADESSSIIFKATELISNYWPLTENMAALLEGDEWIVL